MANASVDKLKALGLRHGEKAVVGLAAAVCLLLIATAATQPTIELTPDQVTQATKSADANLNRKQAPDDILKRIEDAGIKNPNFEKMVDEQMNNKLVAANFRVPNPWVTTEPGAGLLRDKPELIAPTELYAYTGRGGALVYALDENGERIPDKGEKATTESSRRRRRRRRAAAGSSMMASAPAPRKRGRKNTADEKEKLEDYERRAREKAALVTDVDKTIKKEEAEAPTEEGPFKEVTKGLRWASITGVIDYKKLRENYLTALKVASIAYPHFKQLEVQRQTLEADGTWSDWQPVDTEENAKVLNNIPEAEEELTPETSRIDLLVDPLPFLKAGYWERVHYAPLVEQAKIEVEKPKPAATSGGMMSGSMSMQEMMHNQANSSGMMSGSGSPPMMMTPSDYGMGSSMYGGGETIDFPHHDSDLLMIRSLDFTVEPEETYRYRLRIIVYNPNKDREDISPGVDNKSEDLTGPWSEPTEAVTVPADVATYTLAKAVSARRNDQAHFQIARWNAEDGVTVVREFDAGPGDVLGEPRPTQVPNTEGEKATSKMIDFNSRRIILDVDGGNVPLPPGLNGAPLNMPVISLLVRPDGQVVLHDQATDVHDDVRVDTDKNYRRELKESGKKRESSMGSYPGMMMSSPPNR